MNEEPTKDLPDRRSFEERVFARFDAVDSRLEKLESRSYDTKPVWERALTEILETRQDVVEVKSRVGVLETEVASMRTDYGTIRSEFEDLKRELIRQLSRRLDLVLKTMFDQRDDLRDAEDRIRQLETKLA
jgi:chromosome segregation ATPase